MAMREIEYCVVDVFTTRAFQGNSAAVVTDGGALSDRAMAHVAAEINVSETAFVLPATPFSQADLRLRWFSPKCEVSMCGHATIAAIQVLAETGKLPAGLATAEQPIVIETKGGMLQAQIEPPTAAPLSESRPIVWLDLVSPKLEKQSLEPERLAGLLGTSPDAFAAEPAPVRTQDNDFIVFVKDVLRLNALQPAFDPLAAWSNTQRLRGICVSTTSTLAPAITVQSRFFAPAAVGIREDPVTGSVHGPLAAHLVECGLVKTFDNLAALTCVQATPTGRAGLIRVLVQRQADNHYEVRIGGQCTPLTRRVLRLGADFSNPVS